MIDGTFSLDKKLVIVLGVRTVFFTDADSDGVDVS
jgi:hypothetical protein